MDWIYGIDGQRYEYEISCLIQCKNIECIPINAVYQAITGVLIIKFEKIHLLYGKQY